MHAGFDVVSYRRGRDPDMDTAFEKQAARLMATAAGRELAFDVRDVVAELRPELMIVDCMLPAGLAAGESTGTPTASLVHFPYGLARTQMLRGAGAWTTDRAQLNITRSDLGLEPVTDDLAAWESPELLLVTVPTWFDLATDYPGDSAKPIVAFDRALAAWAVQGGRTRFRRHATRRRSSTQMGRRCRHLAERRHAPSHGAD